MDCWPPAGGWSIDGDNRYHAILGNRGPAKFVNASRLAPALITLGARVRIVGPEPDDEAVRWISSASIKHRRPTANIENVLQPGQLVTHVVIPPHGPAAQRSLRSPSRRGSRSAARGCRGQHGRPSRAESSKRALSWVRSLPSLEWPCDAAKSLHGKVINEDTAAIAGLEAVGRRDCRCRKTNTKSSLAQVAVKRALLRAAGYETGGLDGPISSESSGLAIARNAHWLKTGETNGLPTLVR